MTRKLHARENTLFHEQIYRAAHNRFLIKSLQDLHDSVVLLGRTTFAAPGRIAEALGEHQAIVTAIARRDEAAAEDWPAVTSAAATSCASARWPRPPAPDHNIGSIAGKKRSIKNNSEQDAAKARGAIAALLRSTPVNPTGVE